MERPGHDVVLDADGDGLIRQENGWIFGGNHLLAPYAPALSSNTNNLAPLAVERDFWSHLLSGAVSLGGEPIPGGHAEVSAVPGADGEVEIIVTGRRPSGDVRQLDPGSGAEIPKALKVRSVGGSSWIEDKYSETVTLHTVKSSNGPIVKGYSAYSGSTSSNGRRGLTVYTEVDANGNPISTEVRINGNPLHVDLSDAGAAIGDQLGYLLAGGDRLVGAVASATLQTLGNSLGDFLDNIIGGNSLDKALDISFSSFEPEFLANLKAAGIGAVSSYLTAQLVGALGVEGFAAELTNTVAGTVINTVLSNIGSSNPFAGLDSMALPTAIGSFLGNRLANEIISFDTVGGQLGSAIGSSLGVIAVTAAIGAKGTLLGLQLGAFAGPIGALAGAFIGTIAGGLIGSLFGGTPRSGADVVWDEASGEFVVANVYSKKGGSKDAAESIAAAVAETFNGVVAATGGVLMEPSEVQAGNYGMRKKDYVYRPYSTTDKDAITARFSGEAGAAQLIGYGVYQGLAGGGFKIAGGDIYVKRAIYNGMAGTDASSFDPSIVLGNIATAQRYETYLANSTTINALIAAEPDSVFTAEWAITFARAVELGLTRRHEADWYGGFDLLLDEARTNVANVAFSFDYDPFSDRISRSMALGEYVLEQVAVEAANDNCAEVLAA